MPHLHNKLCFRCSKLKLEKSLENWKQFLTKFGRVKDFVSYELVCQKNSPNEKSKAFTNDTCIALEILLLPSE